MPDIYTPTSAQPYATPTLQTRVANAINALRGKYPQPQQATPDPKVAPETPAGSGAVDDTPAGRALPDASYIGASYNQWSELFKYGVNRAKRYSDYDSLDVGQIAAMLDAVADSCLVSDDGELVGVKIEAKAKYQNIIDEIVENLNLNFNLRFILRDTIKYGDNYVAPIFSENWSIVDYDNPPCRQVFKFSDPHLRLLSGTEKLPLGDRGALIDVPLAYQQKNDAMVTVAGWFPWEMFHLRFSPSKSALYSTKSLIEDVRGDLFKLKMIEESLVVARITRAAPRNVHELDMTGKSKDEAEAAMGEHINNLTQKKLSNNQYVRDTISVDEDYWLAEQYRSGTDGKLYPSLNSIKTIDPRLAGLQRLPDVEHLVRKIFSRVPSELVGILPDRNDITSQDIAASRFYTYLQAMLANQFLTPLFQMGLKLRGYRPEKDDFRIIFPSAQMRSSWRSADARFRDSLSSNSEIEAAVISRKHVAQNKYGFSDLEWEAEKKEIQKEMKEIGQLPNATKPALIRKGEKGSSPESLDTPPETVQETQLDAYRRETAEQMAPILKELREQREQSNLRDLQERSRQPQVTVNLPEQHAPNVTVNVPETKIPPSQVNVTLPEQQAPVVHNNFTMPEQPAAQVTVNIPEQQAPVVNLTFPDQPAPTVNNNFTMPEQQAPQVTVNVPEQAAPTVHNNFTLPEQQAPTVNNNFTIPDQQPPTVTVNVPEQAAPIINVAPANAQVSVNVPEQPAPIIQNNITTPEQPAAQVTVNIPEQAAPTINVSPTPVTVENVMPEQQAPVIHNTVNVPQQDAPTINVSPTPVTMQPAQVTVNVPDFPAPVIHNEVKMPEQPAAQVTVNVPEQAAPTINVMPAGLTVENIVPQQEAPQVVINVPEQPAPTVLVNMPDGAVKVDVSAQIELPESEEMSFTRDELGKVIGTKKKRNYTRRKSQTEPPDENNVV